MFAFIVPQAPQTAQEDPRGASGQTTQVGKGRKTAPGWPKNGPDSPQKVTRGPHESPRGVQLAGSSNGNRPQAASSQVVQRGPRLLKRSSKRPGTSPMTAP
eukprot:6958480-Pyramimonas_sp.AAC.1